jgi:hypothetical protein
MFDEEGNKYLDCINNVATGELSELAKLSLFFFCRYFRQNRDICFSKKLIFIV